MIDKFTTIKTKSDKFWGKVAITDPHYCWLWQGTLQNNGYGDFDFRLRNVRYRCSAHRVSYMLTHNHQIPEGLCVLHRCDNKQCVNPNHLFLGTQLDNIRDMMKKGRHTFPKGEDSTSAKLTLCDVTIIKQRAKNGEKLCVIAKDFPVDSSQISRIVAGKRW